MPAQASRLGLDVDDIEMESRFRRIEIALANTPTLADLSEEGSGDLQRVDTIPQVVGLRVTGSTPGSVTVAWNQVRISNLRRYEIDIAEDLAFATNAQTQNEAGTSFTFNTTSPTGDGGDTVIFMRVLARSSTGNTGPYSVTLNTTTGQAQVNDIADGAVDNDAIQAGAITIDKIDEDTPPLPFIGLDDADVGSQLALTGFISGFRLSNDAGDADNDINITAGVARSADNTTSMRLATEMTKQIDAPWSPGNDAGGFPSDGLSLTDATWYRVFLIQSSTGTVDAGFDTSPTAAFLIAEAVLTNSIWTDAVYRQVGWVNYISAGSGMTRFYSPVSDPEQVLYQGGLSGTSLSISTSTQVVTVDAPEGTLVAVTVRVLQNSGGNDNRYFWIKSTAMTVQNATALSMTHSWRREGQSNVHTFTAIEVEVDASNQVHTKLSTTNDVSSITLRYLGFRYIR